MSRPEPSIQIDRVEWSMLVPHAKRGALFLLSADVDLYAVGVAIANDDSAAVQEWLESGALARPTEVDMGVAADSPFDFVIVQPYVVARAAARSPDLH